MGSSDAVHQRRFPLAPTTKLGRWSAALLGGLIVIVTFRVLVDAAQSGEDSEWLSAAGLAAFASAVAAMAAGWVAILRKGERSQLVILAVAIGTLVTLFELVEQAVS